MEIVGRVSTTDVQIIVVQDLQVKTAVLDQTIGVQGRKAVQDQREITADRDQTIGAQGRKAVRNQLVKTEDQGQKTEDQDQLTALSLMLTPHRIQILAIRQNLNNKKEGAPQAPPPFCK